MLLRHHIEKKELGMKVILFDSWPESGNYEVNLAARGWNSHDKFVLLFDEGQSTYRHFGLWTFFKHVSDGNAEAYNNRVIIFCRHGSPSRRPMDIVMPELRLPFCLPLCKRVSLCSVDYSDLDETPPAGLFLTSMEFGDLIHRRFHHNHFDSAFFNWVYQFTGGHVGGIVELISLIISTDSYRGLRNEELYSRDHVQAELDDLLDRFDNISIGLPSNKVLQTPAITHVLGNICSSTVIRESTFLTAEHRDALQTCYLNGWVHAELLLDNTDGSDGYVLASPLHQRILERKLWGRVPLRSFMSPQVTLLDFVIAVIHEYSPHNLSAGWTIGPGGARRPDGTQFQDEFYRCAHAISPGSTTIFPEYGVGNGTVVFYIPAKKWAVELFPGNQQLAQHCGHFLSSGTYCKHLDISEYIILDFGTTTPRIPHTALQNIYYIVFSEDFSSVRVLNDELKVIQGSILLSAC
ncbi:hypothetical protein M405DRAFT_805032 [Rhizopogon salebrosus TDB-379]|nr:hypothetical protein M405DRAFT_805032 [Rhizopogon salebrosus TDB-379]